MLTLRWSAEKANLHENQGLAEELDVARIEAERAQRAGDLTRAGELLYGVIPDLEAKLAGGIGGCVGERMINEEVRDRDIAGAVSSWTGIPIDSMLQGEREKLLAMEGSLGERVIGQEEAVVAISNAVRRARADLQDPNRPIGSFLFLGPTGVGKTELSKALARFLFDNDQAMVRLDMSEFMEKHSVSRLIGAPPGYVGYDEGGVLTEAVRRRPYQVVLFDEVEKAHPDVFNLLLQVLDDGRLTDGHGRTVDFKNVVLIMTSNLGAEILANQPKGEDSEAVRGDVMAVVKASFRPEFLNRIDEVLLFHHLLRKHMTGIVEIQLRQLSAMLENRKITLDINEAAKTWLADKGYDPVYGARPLRRVIQQELQNNLATMVLAGDISGGDTVHVSVDDGELTIK
jgi:ATP-dependent Clp protease ATP-binding subunit ClpB